MGKILRKIARCVLDCAVNDITDSIKAYEEAKCSVVRECVAGIIPLLEDCPISGDIEHHDVKVMYEGGEYVVENVYLNNEKVAIVNIGGIGYPISNCSIDEIMGIASSVVKEYEMWVRIENRRKEKIN